MKYYGATLRLIGSIRGQQQQQQQQPTGDFTEMLTLRVKAVQEVNNNNNKELFDAETSPVPKHTIGEIRTTVLSHRSRRVITRPLPQQLA